jgi:hypothetical protein
VRDRWQSLMEPERTEHLASPNEGEALGVWMLGVLWALVCLWLGYVGGYWVIPGVLLAGLIALWGWRHPEWLWWFPTLLVVASMLQPLWPLSMRTRFGPIFYLDLLALGIAVVAVVRAVGLSRPLLPRTPIDPLVVAVLVYFGITLLLPASSRDALFDLKRIAVRLVIFYATVTVASRPLGSRWVWFAFPLASALLGLHALWAQTLGAGALVEQARYADLMWNTRHGIMNILLVALPVSVGLALNAGSLAARVAWIVAAMCGAAALALHWSQGHTFGAVAPTGMRWTAVEIGRAALACVMLVTLAWLAFKVCRGRPHEAPRWIAMIATFVGFGVLEIVEPALTGPAVSLLALAAGLVVGTHRADRRAMRSGRRIGPLRRAA